MNIEENPRPPEGINVTPQNQIKELAILSLGVCVFFAFIVFVVWQSLTLVARFIPLSWEARIAAPWVEQYQQVSEHQVQLQARLDRILQVMEYEGDIALTVHYVDSPDTNAFATLGGQIFVLSGLVDSMKSDIGLDMVLAHEAAHILNRDPIQSVAGALGVKLILALATGNGEFAQMSGLMNVGSNVMFLSYSRDQERDADEAALNALEHLYGGLEGADELFVQLNQADGVFEIPEILSTHPHPEERIEYIKARIQQASSAVQ